MEVKTNVASPGAAAANAPATPATPSAPEAGGEAAPSAEAKPEAPAKQEIDFGTRFAALTKKERAVIERERAIKAQEREIAEWKKSKEAAKLDPVAFLESHGLSYDQVTQFILNDRKLTEGQRLAMLEERLKKEDEERAKAAKNAERAEVTQTITQHKAQIADFIAQGGDDFEVTRSYGEDGADLVFQVIEERYNATFDAETGVGEIIPIEVAARQVEDYLENLARERVLKLKKFQPKIEVVTDAVPSTPPAKGVAPEIAKRPAPTLTNAAVASIPPVDSRRDLSDEESKRLSASLLRWN